MWNLFLAEWMKTRKRPANWVLAFLVLGILLIAFTATTIVAWYEAQENQTSTSAQQLMTFPHGFRLPLLVLSALGSLIGIVFVANSVGSEYSGDTWKALLPRRGNRRDFLISKLAASLCFMIPFLGIGTLPALVALFLYALLPIVRGTATGLATLDRHLLEIADVFGLTGWRRLARIELPLASVSILAGVKTAAIWTVGTATLAAFIGGGGYGTLIVRGLALDDVTTILAGAIPAALMALVFHGIFELVDRLLVPRGLRLVMARAR